MREDFLHYVWRMKRFDMTDMLTTAGENIDIVAFGEHNKDAGPDFSNAKIRIGAITWAGCVEMHTISSEWLKHGHQHNEAYQKVILHVVYEEDQILHDAQGNRIPCLELRGRIPEGIYKKYWALLHNERWIPCQHEFTKVMSMTKNMWLDRLLVERLETKTQAIDRLWQLNNGDWEETFYQYFARYLGAKVNGEPFELLARSLSHKILAKHKDNRLQLEALLFGQAGMLDGVFLDDYPQKLQKEYLFLKHKHQLTPIQKVSWKYARMRPPALPTIRIAQLAMLVHQSSHLFSKCLEANNIRDIEVLLETKLSDYWLDHYVFDQESERSHKSLGAGTILILTINVIAPFLFFYGKKKNDEKYKDKALALLDEVLPEENAIIRGWKKLGEVVKTAAQTQALLQLKNEYCDKKRCLECAIGHKVLG
jgi:hypothetical protein